MLRNGYSVSPEAPEVRELRRQNWERSVGFTQIPNTILYAYWELGGEVLFTYAVMRSFAYRENEEGIPMMFVGQKKLAAARHVCVRTLQYHIQKLVKAGLICVSPRGIGRSNMYYFMPIPEERIKKALDIKAAIRRHSTETPVSYTHLTLPTICSV